jgi:hypothetical protein
MKYSFSTHSKPCGGSIPLSTLEGSQDVCCHLNGELRITYCNPAWDRFALDNGGGFALSHRVVGSMIMDSVPSELTEFYSAVFAKARDAVVGFAYECSSPELYRSFQMQILSVEQPTGFVLINALRVEQRMEGRRAALALSPEYVSDAGIVTVCSHCRRSRRVDLSDRWDWVPANLNPTLGNVSHGLCPMCHAYFYGEWLSKSLDPVGNSAA